MAFTNPQTNIEQLNLTGKERIVIFGSGAGGHSFAAARVLDGGGRVYAVDVRQEMLDKVREEAVNQGIVGIEVKLGNCEHVGGTGVQATTIDVVIIPNTLFAYDDRPGVFKEAARLLKPGGRVMVIDWRESFGGMGPQQEDLVRPEQARELAETEGFELDREFFAGAQHYGMIFIKK